MTDEERDDFDSIARTVRFARRAGWYILAGLASSIIGGALYVSSAISVAAELRGSNAVRLEVLEHSVLQLQQDLRDMRRERKDIP
jgi:hypothetical protein